MRIVSYDGQLKDDSRSDLKCRVFFFFSIACHANLWIDIPSLPQKKSRTRFSLDLIIATNREKSPRWIIIFTIGFWLNGVITTCLICLDDVRYALISLPKYWIVIITIYKERFNYELKKKDDFKRKPHALHIIWSPKIARKAIMFTFENCHTIIISSLTSYQENIVIWKEEKKPTNLRHKIICSMAFVISYIQISYTFR